MNQQKNDPATQLQLNTFSKNLRRLLEEKGIKQNTLAEKLGVSTAAVSMWTQGKKYPRPGYVAKIAEILDVPISILREEATPRDNQYYTLGQAMASADAGQMELLHSVLSLSDEQQQALKTLIEGMRGK